MALSVFTIEQAEEWDKIVRTFENSDVYYLSGYVKAFQLHGDGEPILFYYEENKCRGINVVMRRDVASCSHFIGRVENGLIFDLITPYGYGGWLIEGDVNTDKLFSEYENWCIRNNIISEFVRFHPVLKNHMYAKESYNVIPLGNTIAMDLSSPEVIWQNITSKNRNMIRKAQKSGIVIYNGRYPEIFAEFRKIYNGTMDKDNADDYYYFKEEFYQSIMSDLKNEAQIFYAELDGKVIAASIILATNGKLNYHLSGSVREYQNLAPTNLLLYEAALWGCLNGCKTFHLGGGVGSCEDSLYKFKSAFYRDEPCRFHIGKKIFNQDKYNELVSTRQKDGFEGSSFFPEYRG